ncbi:MAG: hypothetical protein ACR2P7_08255 [bacterium]
MRTSHTKIASLLLAGALLIVASASVHAEWYCMKMPTHGDSATTPNDNSIPLRVRIEFEVKNKKYTHRGKAYASHPYRQLSGDASNAWGNYMKQPYNVAHYCINMPAVQRGLKKFVRAKAAAGVIPPESTAKLTGIVGETESWGGHCPIARDFNKNVVHRFYRRTANVIDPFDCAGWRKGIDSVYAAIPNRHELAKRLHRPLAAELHKQDKLFYRGDQHIDWRKILGGHTFIKNNPKGAAFGADKKKWEKADWSAALPRVMGKRWNTPAPAEAMATSDKEGIYCLKMPVKGEYGQHGDRRTGIRYRIQYEIENAHLKHRDRVYVTPGKSFHPNENRRLMVKRQDPTLCFSMTGADAALKAFVRDANLAADGFRFPAGTTARVTEFAMETSADGKGDCYPATVLDQNIIYRTFLHYEGDSWRCRWLNAGVHSPYALIPNHDAMRWESPEMLQQHENAGTYEFDSRIMYHYDKGNDSGIDWARVQREAITTDRDAWTKSRWWAGALKHRLPLQIDDWGCKTQKVFLACAN